MIEAGKVYNLAPNVRRITAPNGSIMTGPGTNTYLIGFKDVVIIDPGPKNEQHILAILDAIESGDGRIHSIWVTHTHRDHSPAAAELARLSGAPCYGAMIPDDGFQDVSFIADVSLTDGLVVESDEWCIEAIHTPGHIFNHFCFFLRDQQMLFVGDHLMEGTTVVIIPPHGVMKDYIESLHKMLLFPMAAIAPGHGDVLSEPVNIVKNTITHRLARERLLLQKMNSEWAETSALVVKVYKGLDPRLLPFAERSLLAHLIKLADEGRAECDDQKRWRKLS